MMCRQCPGYKADVSQLLFATGSNYWLPGLPAPAPVPPPPKPAATEGCAKAAGEQPSTSSDGPSGDGEYLHLKFSHIHCWNSKNGSHTVVKSLHINSSNMPFCSIPEHSSPRVSLPPSGHPPHLHLLPPADARQTDRAQQPAGCPAMWVASEAVNSANSCAGIRFFCFFFGYLVFNLSHLFGLRAVPNSALPASAVLLFMCGEIIV